MPRRTRIASGGVAYHVLNRGVGRMTLFDDEADYAACLLRLPPTADEINQPAIALPVLGVVLHHVERKVIRPAESPDRDGKQGRRLPIGMQTDQHARSKQAEQDK